MPLQLTSLAAILAEEVKSADEQLRVKESGDELVQTILQSQKVMKGIATAVNEALANVNASLSHKK